MAEEKRGAAPDENEGGDPTEEVGPEECAPGVEECEFKAGSIDETANATFPKFMDEVADAYTPEPGKLVLSPEDGLPIPADESSEVLSAPPFTIDHVVCVEDDREYVEVFRGEGRLQWFQGSDITDTPVGDLSMAVRDCFTSDGEKTIRFHFAPGRVIELWGCKLVELNETELLILKDREDKLILVGSVAGPYYMAVRPARERCIHYARQILSHDGQPDPSEPGHRIVFRNCMIRRSVGGAFMGLRDEAVYACDYRNPPDPSTVKKFLDDPDHEKLRSEAYKVKLPLFKRG